MSIAKKDKINRLTDEVNEVHPLLSELFKKLATIIGVEYTHGNKEFGADFLLSQNYEPLNTVEYIGVIVKAKNITQASLEDVERQIKECSMPRLIENGKKKIVLSSIWVVSTQNIAGNAQEKINYSFSDKKVQFIDDEKLVLLIDKYLPNYWYDMKLQISNYLSQLSIRIEEEDKRYLLIPNISHNVYIEPDIVHITKEGYDYKDGKKKRLFENVNIYDEIEKHRFLIVEGQMGAGKSKLLRHIGSHYCDPDVYIEKHVVPIAINYRTLCEQHGCNISSLIDDHLTNHGIVTSKEINMVILIDGFDEYNETVEEHIEKVKYMLKQKEQLSNLSLVIATRFVNVINNEDFNGANAKKVELSSLSVKKMIQFLTTLCSELSIADRLIADITKSPLMKELPQSPIAAILLAKIIQTNSKDLPSNMPELYQKYLELVLGRWDIDKGLESQKEYDVALAIVIQLAQYFIENEIDEVSIDVLDKTINDYLSPRNLGISNERVREILIKRSGIVLHNIDNDTVMFSHRTFAEYFYAKGKSETSSLAVDEKVFSVYWMNIYYFYIGIKRDCPDYLQSIIDFAPKSENQRWIKIINLSNFLMAGYSTPYSIVENNLHKILLDSAKLYNDIVTHSMDSIFKNFPEVVMLWWIQFTIRSSYSYSYFSKSIDDCVLRIVEDKEATHPIKAYALFFLSMVGLEQKNTNPFDYLITEYKDDLPDSVQIGIFNEIERLDKKTTIEMKSLKWFGKRLKSIEKKYLHDLFELPIGKRKIT